MRKAINFITVIIISFFVMVFLAACQRESKNKIYNIDISGVVFEDKTYTYDGNVHNIYISGTIPSGVIVTYTGNSKVNVGTYEVIASFQIANGYTKIADMKANMTIEKAPVTGIEFKDKTFEYDGLPHSLAVEGELPESLVVDYRYNTATEVGTYEVEAHFSSTEINPNFIIPEPMKANMTISKKVIDNITFENQTFPYDGKSHSIGIKGELPTGVNVNYEGNVKSEAGTYEVTANFNDTTGNYSISNMSALMTIEKVNMEGVSFENTSFMYDGLEHKIEVSNLPEGVEVSYSPTNTYKDAGKYEVTANLNDTTGNYNVPSEMTATLIIFQKSLPVEFNDKEVTYNGLEHKLEIEGSLPEGVTVSYTTNSYTDSGVYEVTASFEDLNNNYIIDDMIATLTIKKADLLGISLENKTVTYDGSPKSIDITGQLDESISSLTEYTKEFKNNNKINAGTYYVHATITPTNENFNELILDATLIIDKAEIEGITMEDVTVDYDGTSKTIFVTGDVPSGIAIDYYYNGDMLKEDQEGVVNAGIYEVTAVLRESTTSNYKISKDLTAILTINKIKPSKDIEFKDGIFVYDNKTHSIFIDEENLPEHITVSNYTNNEAVNMGKYIVVAYLEDDSGNYDIPDSISATMTIYHLEDDIYYIGNDFTKTAEVIGCKDEVVEANIKNNISASGVSYTVTTIESGSLKDTDNRHLKKIIVPNTIKNLDEGVFAGSSSLESIELSFVGNSSENSQYPFGYIFGTEEYEGSLAVEQKYKTEADTLNKTYYIPSSLKDITISDGTTNIGYGAFANCSSLTSITIPASVTSIGEDAFKGCAIKEATIPAIACPFINNSNLEKVTITSGETISNEAFSNCSSLVNITIAASVTSIGEDAFKGCAIKEATIPAMACPFINNSNLEKVTITSGETIPSDAFSNCSSLTSVTIPASVTSIGEDAFSNCSALTSITIPASVTSIGGYAFYQCSSLQSITMPDSVTSIGGYAFFKCQSLTSITIPANVTSIGHYAFYECSSLTSITIPASVTSLGYYAFAYCYRLVEVINKSSLSITAGSSGDSNIGDYAKQVITDESDSKLSTDSNGFITYNDGTDTWLVNYIGSNTEIVISNNVTKINDYAFYKCNSLTSITIPESITSIGKYAFDECAIKEATIPAIACPFIKDSKIEKVTIISGETIPSNAFYNCSFLTSITILASVTSIGDYAFADCKSLTSVIIPASVTSIGNRAFTNCTSLQSITIPTSVTSIGSYVFYNCTSLESITIPASVTSIGKNAFALCSSLESITFLASVTSIGSFVFYNCTSLESITIPASVTSIEEDAFYSCSSLTSITIPASVTSIGEDAFKDCALQYVYYKGTSMSGITIDNSNDCLIKATWYYFTSNGANETASGKWWYYDNSDNTIKTIVNE